MISTLEADRLIDQTFAAHARSGACAETPVALSIGRILGKDIVADRDHPPFNRVAMDGIAVVLDDNSADHGERQNFHLNGRLPPGVAEPEGRARSESGNAIEVMTGAALPHPWNAVIPWEDLDVGADDKHRSLRAGARLSRGMNVHSRASDYRQGDLLVAAGTRIAAPHVHILASVGCGRVPVLALPRITLVATGDELVAVDAMPLPHQIRMSNMVALEACLHGTGLAAARVMHLPDRAEPLRAGLADALATSDIVLVSGGVSKGSKDFVPALLQSLGCDRVFHGVAHKPGKPIWFGTWPEGVIVFGLPGNPVSSLVCFVRYVLPRLRRWGETRGADDALSGSLTLPLAEHADVRPQWTLFLPGLVETRSDGTAAVAIRKSQGSGNFAGLLPSDGIAELPPGNTAMHAGAPVRFFPWP